MGLPTSLPGPVAGAQSPATPILTLPPLINFATRQVDPPTAFYVTAQDNLHLAAWCATAGVPVNCQYTLLRAADGVVITSNLALTITNTARRNDAFAALPEGFLLSVNVSTSQNVIVRGRLFCAAMVSRAQQAGSDRMLLASDYVTTEIPSGWPGGQQRTSIEGPGWVHEIVFASTPGNGQLSAQPGTNLRWRVLAIQGTFTTDATVLSRNVRVNWAPINGAPSYSYDCPNTQPASQTVSYCAADVAVATPAPGAPQVLPIPEGFLESSGTIALVATNGLATDTWASGVLWVEEWINAAI